MRNFLLFIFFLASTITQAQKIHRIAIRNDLIEIKNREFYIGNVIDKRANKNLIGVVKIGIFNTKRWANLENGVSVDVYKFYANALKKEGHQIPITLIINKFEIYEKMTITKEIGIVDINVSYYYNDIKLFDDVQHTEVTSMDVTNFHGQNIAYALSKSAFAFNGSGWQKIINDTNLMVDSLNTTADTSITVVNNPKDEIVSVELDNKSGDNKNRNVIIIGYQIGGLSAIGFDYEIRFHDYFGFHTGAGFLGYTAGLNVHLRPTKNSSFFNLSYKDSGFGLMSVAGIEYAAKWVFSPRSDFGLHLQFGIGKILNIDSSFEQILYGNQSAPLYTLTMGIGLSW